MRWGTDKKTMYFTAHEKIKGRHRNHDTCRRHRRKRFSDKAMGVLTQHINNVQITKKAEWEADNLAFDYCYQAGYNPGAGAALWERVIEKRAILPETLSVKSSLPMTTPATRSGVIIMKRKSPHCPAAV